MILHNTTANSHFVGRANAVFVFGQDENAPSVISTVVATVRDQINSDRILLRGDPVFDEKATDHIINTVLPVVDGVVKRLGLAERCFELSLVNIEATSVLEIAFTISGFSADLPIFLAMLSTILQIPIPSNIVSTGHIASPDGDIRMVKGIPTKLTSAINAENIHTFIHPSIDQDNSLGSFSPLKKEIISDAITKAKPHIETIAVSDINELVRAVFTEESVVVASLRQSFIIIHPKRILPILQMKKRRNFLVRGYTSVSGKF